MLNISWAVLLSKCGAEVAHREVDAKEDAACRANELRNCKEQRDGKALDLWGQCQRKHDTQRPLPALSNYKCQSHRCQADGVPAQTNTDLRLLRLRRKLSGLFPFPPYAESNESLNPTRNNATSLLSNSMLQKACFLSRITS